MIQIGHIVLQLELDILQAGNQSHQHRDHLVIAHRRYILLVVLTRRLLVVQKALQIALHQVVVEGMVEPGAATSVVCGHVEQALQVLDHIAVRELEHEAAVALLGLLQAKQENVVELLAELVDLVVAVG